VDKTTGVGILIGIGAIILANAIEGGHFGALFQLTAAIIVFGGTAGATIVSHRKEDLVLAVRLLVMSFKNQEKISAKELSNEIMNCAKLARAESPLTLETRIKSFKSSYMKTVFRYLIDGADPTQLKEAFEKEQDLDYALKTGAAKVWADAGGYAPTIGILGAVLGLIHVMSQLTDTSVLGKGIAVAFVATIYGVGSANLIFLPIANKIKKQIQYEMNLKEMILEGALAILKGQNPYLIQEKMNAYVKTGDEEFVS